MKNNSILRSMPSVSSIINKVKREVQIHENYLNYLINLELDVIREKILDNGIKVMVPPFISQNEAIVVNTETMEYSERA